MARLKNFNPSPLTPQQMKFFKGLRDAGPLAPGDKVFRAPERINPKPKINYPSHGNPALPDESIYKLAHKAAVWLSQHQKKALREEGYPAFMANRIREILTGEFPSRFWEVCELVDESTWSATPTCTTGDFEPLAKFQTPGSKNSDCVYESCSQGSGDAGFDAYTHADGYFKDTFLNEKQFVFKIPKPPFSCGVRPTFSKHEATWRVTHQHKNHEFWSCLYKAGFASSQSALPDRSVSVDKIGRFYYWDKKIPKPAVNGSTHEMTRNFVVDSLYLSTDGGYNPDADGFSVVKIAPASCRGKYHFKNHSVSTVMQNTCSMYVAKPADEHDPECADGPTLYDLTTSGGYTWYFTAPASVYPRPTEGFSWIQLPARHYPNSSFPPDYHPWKLLPSITARCNLTGKQITYPFLDEYIPLPSSPNLYRPSTAGLQVTWGPNAGVAGSLNFIPYHTDSNGWDSCLLWEAWGYVVFDKCKNKYVAHSFPGPMPDWEEFMSQFASGMWPL